MEPFAKSHGYDENQYTETLLIGDMEALLPTFGLPNFCSQD